MNYGGTYPTVYAKKKNIKHVISFSTLCQISLRQFSGVYVPYSINEDKAGFDEIKLPEVTWNSHNSMVWVFQEFLKEHTTCPVESMSCLMKTLFLLRKEGFP